MRQRGVDLPSLDVTYFTSLSYYILLLFGLRGVFMLFFREATIDETQMYRQQMGMGGAREAFPAPSAARSARALCMHGREQCLVSAAPPAVQRGLYMVRAAAAT